MEQREEGGLAPSTRRDFIKTFASLFAGRLVASVLGEGKFDDVNKLNLAGLKTMIPADHLVFYKTRIYPTIATHVTRIMAQADWAKTLSFTDLYHVHLYYDRDYRNPLVQSITTREKELTYLYHSKELSNDHTRRNIFIDHNGRFEALDDEVLREDNAIQRRAFHVGGRELTIIYFADSLPRLNKIIEHCQSVLDRESFAQVGGLYFLTSYYDYILNEKN